MEFVTSLANWLKAQIGIVLLWSPWLPAFIRQASRVYQEFWLPKPDWDTVTHMFRALLNAFAPTQASQIIIRALYVAKFAKKDDLILFNSNFVEILFDYYFKPYEELYSIQVVRRGVPLDLFDSRILEPKMTTKDIPGLISLLSGHNRVWLVYSHESYTDPLGLIPQALASQMELIRTREFYGGKV